MKQLIAMMSLMVLSGCCSMPERAAPVKRTAYVAKVPEENLEAVRELCAGFRIDEGRGGGYLREIEGDTYLFLYLEESEAADSVAHQALKEIMDAGSLSAEALPLRCCRFASASLRVAKEEACFEPMEQLFYEAGVEDKEPDGEVMRIAMFTGLKPEKEAHYRLLHDNPWPDVIAAIRRANFRHFSIFQEEIEGKLYLFGWLEYVGADIAADDAVNKKDPASIRWWKETDACQIAPPDSNGGLWGGLEELYFAE